MAVPPLAKKLRSVRQARGITLYGAAKQMPHTGYGTLHHLEHQNADASPANPSDVTIRTVMDIIDFYYPDIDLGDFVPLHSDLRVQRISNEP